MQAQPHAARAFQTSSSIYPSRLAWCFNPNCRQQQGFAAATGQAGISCGSVQRAAHRPRDLDKLFIKPLTLAKCTLQQARNQQPPPLPNLALAERQQQHLKPAARAGSPHWKQLHPPPQSRSAPRCQALEEVDIFNEIDGWPAHRLLPSQGRSESRNRRWKQALSGSGGRSKSGMRERIRAAPPPGCLMYPTCYTQQ